MPTVVLSKTSLINTKGPFTYDVTLSLAFLDAHPPAVTLCDKFKTTPHPPNVSHHIMNFNAIFFWFCNNVGAYADLGDIQILCHARGWEGLLNL